MLYLSLIHTKEFDMQAEMNLLGSNPLPESKKQTWVQTERASHEAWAGLVRTNPRAATLLHVLVAQMDRQSAVVASRATLSALTHCSEATTKRAIATLKAEQWIEVVQIGGKGGVNAYVINSRVAWADKRDKLPDAVFTATVLARRSEQDEVDTVPLRRIPSLYPGERQLPTGDSRDMPALKIDKETGEILGGMNE